MRVIIDASLGGGQVLRTALALATITNQSITIEGIRANRPKPGLKAQHLAVIHAFERLFNAKVQGAKIHSQSIHFVPGVLQDTKLKIDIGTAGSITLLAQALLPAIIATKKKVHLEIIGGTDVAWSPSIDYFERVFCKALEEIADIKVKTLKRGYYPKGGGEVHIEVKAKNGKQLDLGDAKVLDTQAIIHCSEILEQEANALRKRLLISYPKARVQLRMARTASTGIGFTLWSRRMRSSLSMHTPAFGVDGIASKGILEAFEKRSKEFDTIASEGGFDEHLIDQIVPYLFLFGGHIEGPATSKHTLTNIDVCEKLTKLTCEKEKRSVRISQGLFAHP